MNVKFASRMAGLGASAIREIMKLTQRPEVISFAGGLPAAEWYHTVVDNGGLSRFKLDKHGLRLVTHNWRPSL